MSLNPPSNRRKTGQSGPARASVAKPGQKTAASGAPANAKPAVGRHAPAVAEPDVTALDRRCNRLDWRFLNREEGLLAFNERVLSQALDRHVPLLERLRFITIVSNNLDEFFEVRMAELKQKLALGRGDEAANVRTMAAQALRASRLVELKYKNLNENVMPALSDQVVLNFTNDHRGSKLRT